MHILRKIRLLCCSLLLLWGSLQTAWGHALPRRAEPAVGATVHDAPALVRIWFDKTLELAFSRLQVQTAQGQPVEGATPLLDCNDATLLAVRLPPLASGRYRVLWVVLAQDGHRTEGTYTFTVGSGP